MEKSKKVKITLGLFYLLVVSSFLYFFLSKFTLEELTSYEFIKNNRDYFFGLKQTNLFLISLTFLIATISRVYFWQVAWNDYSNNWNDYWCNNFIHHWKLFF